MHKQKYEKFRQKHLRIDFQNLEENQLLVKSVEYLHSNSISCTKLNYSLDIEVQYYTSYPAFLEIKNEYVYIQTLKSADDRTTTGSQSGLHEFKTSSGSFHVDDI
jgi:hypothetical protein